MQRTARDYARKVLLAHLLLLGAVLAAVGMTAREIYYSARQQAVTQAKQRQELLSDQTVRGITGFYSAIISDLELFRKRAETDESTTQPSTAPVTAPSELGPPPQTRGSGPRFAAREPQFLWNQLGGRVSALFVYHRGVSQLSNAVEIWEPHEDVPPPPPGEGRRGPGPNAGPGVGRISVPPEGRRGGLLIEGGRGVEPPPVAPRVQKDVTNLATGAQSWLEKVDTASVSDVMQVPADSPLQSGGAGNTAVNLVAVPLGPQDRWLIVAVVPATDVQSQVLPPVTDRQLTSATLVDHTGNVIISTDADLPGHSLVNASDPQLGQLVQAYKLQQSHPAADEGGTQNLGGQLVTVAAVDTPEVNWTLLMSSSIGEVDTVVQGLFRTVIFWAGLLVIAMTAILVSTAVQFIRNRANAERTQHQVLKRELAQARQIQLNWLPNRTSGESAIDIAAVNEPASLISGDFYNWFDLPDGRQVVTIGDVTGHGMSAAFLMATTQLLVRTTMPRVLDPGECMVEVNRQLCTQVFHGQFVTMLILLLDVENGTMEIATAGHAPPLVSTAGAPFKPLPMKPQLVLAVEEKQQYPTEKYDLPPDSSILLYTDGVIDLQSPDKTRFDAKRLRDTLSGKYTSAQGIIDALSKTLSDFRKGQELEDDLTMVAIQVRATKKSTDEQREPAMNAAER